MTTKKLVPLLIVLLGTALVIAPIVAWFEPPKEGGVLTIAGAIISFLAGLGASIKGWKDLFKKDKSDNSIKQEMTNQSESSTPIQAQTVNIYQTPPNQLSYAERGNDINPQPTESAQIAIFHNLPPRNEFVGREDEKEKVHLSLLALHPNVISIDGIGGVGKTALALQISYECLDASRSRQKNSNQVAAFDGFIWATAKDRELVLDNILDEIARTLNQDIITKQPLEEKILSIKKLLQNNHYLLIVDGYEVINDTKVQDFLTHVPESSKVLITTREQKFIEAWSVSLKGLPDKDAIVLIRTHGNTLGLKAIELAEETVLLQICETTDGHPLATKWVLGQIKQKGLSLDKVLEFLKNAKGNIFDQILLRSWELLSEDARQILRVMPIFANDTFQLAVQRTSGIKDELFYKALGQLVEMSLVDTTDTLEKRYSIHPLTRAFALAKLEMDPQVSYNARKELASFFEQYTQEHGGLWNLSGFEKLRPDIPNIISVIQWCWHNQSQELLIELGVDIFDNIRYFIVNDGRWKEALELAQGGINFFNFDSQKPPKIIAQWQIKVMLFRIWPIAWIYRFRGFYELAKEEINLTLALLKYVNDEDNIAKAQRHLGLVLLWAGEIEEAENFLQESLEFEKSKGNIYRTHLLTADLADLALQKGDLVKANRLSEIVIKSPLEIQDKQCKARFYRVLGSVERQQGNLREAKILCEESLRYTKGLQYLDGIADISFELAQIDMQMGQLDYATKRYKQAHEIYEKLGMKHKAKEIENIFSQLVENLNAKQ